MSKPSVAGTQATDGVQVLGQVLALAALLLPAVGVGVRWMAFNLDPVELPALRIAVSAPLAQLVATGIVALLIFAIPSSVVVAGLFVIGRARGSTGGHQIKTVAKQLSPFVGLLIGLLLTLLFVVCTILFLPQWPVTTIYIVTGVASGFWLSRIIRLPRRELRLSHLWPVVVILLATSAIVTPLTGYVPGVEGGFVTLEGKEETWLYEVGRTSDIIYFRTCGIDDGRAVAVASEAVKSIRYLDVDYEKRGELPSLWQVITHHARVDVGIQYRCPRPQPGA